MNFSSFLSAAFRLLAPLGLGSVALAEVRYVDPSGNGQFMTIQAGINGSLDGDVLLVRSGAYSGFTLDGRSLSVIASAGAQVKVTSTVFVRHIAAEVLLTGLDITGMTGNPGASGLQLLDNPGHVRLQACTIRGGRGNDSLFSGKGGDGAWIENSAKVVFVGCSLTGGNGGGFPLFIFQGGDGGRGAAERGSAVAFYDCVLKGGAGGSADYYASSKTAGEGGHGCEVLDFGILASGCQFQGGTGGGEASVPGNGGHGLVVDAGQAQSIDNTYAGGLPGQGYYGNFGLPGQPQSGPGTFNSIPGAARRASGPVLAAEGTTVQLQLSGEPGDRVWLLSSDVPGFLYLPGNAGILCVPLLNHAAFRPIATLPPSGAATVPLRVPLVGVGTPLLRQFRQVVVVNSAGQVRLGSPLHIAVINCSELLPDCNANASCDECDLLQGLSFDCDKNGVPDECQPDCNGNGVADPCDIAGGTSVDLNHNGIPDECEPQTTWYIDANAAPGGNGSAGAPFQTLGAAFQLAISNDTIRVADGLYQGAGNRNLTFGGRDLVVQSSGGAANCILDCQLQGRAFLVDGGVTEAGRIEGFTIRNGRVTGQQSQGGGILVQGSKPIIRSTVFETCEATNGAGVMLDHSGALLEGCNFHANRCIGNGEGGGARIATSTGARLLDCSFFDNQAPLGAGVASYQSLTSLERCLFYGNVAVQTGGGLFAYFGTAYIDQCWFSGNRAALGGGIASTATQFYLSSSTIADNRATQRAGAVYYSSASSAARSWRNCILWNNTAPAGTAIELLAGPLDVAWCDVQGGQASVTLGTSTTLTWDASNFDLDPLFVDPDGPDNDPLTIADNDYRLSLASPCLDAGDNASVVPDSFDLDGDGNVTEPVPVDFDGHARFVETPSAPNTGSGTPPLVDLGAWERP